MRTHRLSRKQIGGSSEEDPEPLGKLRRRCTGGAIGASSAYLAVLIDTVARPTDMSDPVTIGLLIAFGTVAALSVLGAVLAWAVQRIPAEARSAFDEQRADDLTWAYQLGTLVAGTLPSPRKESVTPRGPKAR